MTPVLAFRPSVSTTEAPQTDLVDRVICPGCHTVDLAMTVTAINAGAAWQCARCAQQWDADRLAAVGGYAAWVAARSATATEANDARRNA